MEIIIQILSYLIPIVIASTSLVIKASSIDIAPLYYATPTFILASIFYFRLYRKRSFPITLAALIGLIYDALLFLPLGVTSALFILFALLLDYRRWQIRRQLFLVQWIIYGMLFTAYTILISIVLKIGSDVNVKLEAATLNLAISILVYPIIHYVLFKICPPIKNRLQEN